MSKEIRNRSALKMVGDLTMLSLLYVCYYGIRHHRPPHIEEWLEALVVWYLFYSIQGGYRRIVGELERQNALLVKVLTCLEESRR